MILRCERRSRYLSRKVNETVAPWMDEGFGLLIEIVNVTGGDDSHWGLNIWVEKTFEKKRLKINSPSGVTSDINSDFIRVLLRK